MLGYIHPDATSVSHVKKTDVEKRMVYGEVYAPYQLDTHGEMMLPEDIEKIAHRFLQLDLGSVIDVQHDNVPRDAVPVESFIARDNDPDFASGAWVLGVKILDEQLWEDCKSGKYNGFSFEAMVKKIVAVIDYEVLRDNFGETERNLDHTHLFWVELNDDGVVIGGRTTTDYGHSHEIVAGTATEMSGNPPHTHRIFVGG